MVCVFVGEGFRIKKGWNVNVDAKSVHLDPTVYIDPGKFNPSRFDVRKHSFTSFLYKMLGLE